MSALGIQARVNTRAVKKLEKPRPLKLSTSQSRHAENRLSLGAISVDEVMTLADNVCQHISNGNCDRSLQSNVLTLSSSLKLYGQQLETIYKDQLDRLFVIFRNGSRDEKLDYVSRLHLLELVELRGSNWTVCDNMSDYYRHKIAHNHETEILDSPVTPSSALAPLGQFGQASAFSVLGLSPSTPTTPQPTLLGPGEILKTSGKFPKPTKIPNKNYCKDEVVIRNSDSGKVNPGAKERLVQITGPTEEKIIHARQLMEDTIRRNASPVRPEQSEGLRDHHEVLGGSSSSLNSSASDDSVRVSQAGVRRSTLLHSFSTNDASLGEYKYTVAVSGCLLKITGSNHDIVRAAKLVLDEYFTGQEYFDSYEEELPSPSASTATASNNVDPTSVGSSADSAVLCSPSASPANPVLAGTTIDTAMPVSQSETVGISNSTADSIPPIAPSSSVESSTSESDETIRAATPSLSSEPVKRTQYCFEELLTFATSPISREVPSEWQRIARDFPSIVKKVPELWACGYAGDYVGNYSSSYCYDYEYDYMSHYMGGYYPNGYVTGYMGDMHGACAVKWNPWGAGQRRFTRRMIPVYRPS